MNNKEKAKELVAQMSLEEKASLCSGKNFWFLQGNERLGLLEIMVTDGPHGLRKQEDSADHLGLNKSVPAVCFPTAAATACTFDRDLLKEMGRKMGEECRQENVSVILGPGLNIKRSPLCGRNFEYFSEDPLLSGEMAAALVNGIQSENVGVSVKHFAANNQEKRRMTEESVVDERTLREIYLSGFENVIKKSNPATVMCSYNLLRGEFASQNEWLLTKVLRDEWSYDGVVVSDWGAVVDRVKGLQAGMDIEMPNVGPENDARIVRAVKDGRISEAKLNQTALRVVELILKTSGMPQKKYNTAAHHAFARQVAATAAVLLKNEGGILPGNLNQKAAVLGAFAKSPRYQGTGSSKIVPTSLDEPCEELRKLGLDFEYAEGYALESDQPDDALIRQACETAKDKDVVYIFAGLPDKYESETLDRTNMNMPTSHNRLIEEVCKINSKVVVILMGGSPMALPWADKVQGILLMYLGGEAVGGACADLLLGKTQPCGRLPESWPFSEQDSPSHGNFPGYPLTVEYREGPFVGYRYYATANKKVCFPFGFGLSYTKFEYSDLKLSAKSIKDTDTLTVTCTVKNSGNLPGSEVVQLYVACQNSMIIRPAQELKGFEKITLQPGESKTVIFKLAKRDFAYYNVKAAQWHVENADYEIRIASCCQDIRLAETCKVQNTEALPLPDHRQDAPSYYQIQDGIHIPDKEFETLLGHAIPPRERQKGTPHTIVSTIWDIQDKWLGRQLMGVFKSQAKKMAAGDPDMQLMMESMMMDMPLHLMTMMGGFSIVKVEGLVDLLNGHFFKGLKGLLSK